MLVKLAQLAADLPEVKEVDLNPLLADEHGVIVVDARAAVVPVDKARRARLAIPAWRSGPILWNGSGTPRLRTAPRSLPGPCGRTTSACISLWRRSPSRICACDLAPVKEFGHAFIARFTQLDYARAMAFVAIEESTGTMLGVVRLHADANYDTAEYAVLVRSDLQGKGLGWQLMQLIIEYARSEGLREIEGQVLNENSQMLRMCAECGFSIAPDPLDPDTRIVRLRP